MLLAGVPTLALLVLTLIGVARLTTEIDAMTQQNAALVEQVAAATESLEDQARQLARSVSLFKFNR